MHNYPSPSNNSVKKWKPITKPFLFVFQDKNTMYLQINCYSFVINGIYIGGDGKEIPWFQSVSFKYGANPTKQQSLVVWASEWFLPIYLYLLANNFTSFAIKLGPYMVHAFFMCLKQSSLTLISFETIYLKTSACSKFKIMPNA